MGEVFKLFLSTPSARRATSAEQGIRRYHHISIHALREEGDVQTLPEVPALQISIHALREEGDKPKPQQHVEQIYFYPRPPRGGRRWQHTSADKAFNISIHALREEGDRSAYLAPVGSVPISIHALREEGDRRLMALGTSESYFYPRPPRGGRRNTSYQRAMDDIFLSTPSARRATEAEFDKLPIEVKFLSTPSARRATREQ